MATWPSYAEIMFDGFSEVPDSAVIQTEMDDGPAKMRRVKSRVMVRRAVSVLLLSAADYQSFKAWFASASGANRGAAWFDWTDPVDGVVRQARVMGGVIGGAAPMRLGLSTWRVSLTLESWDA